MDAEHLLLVLEGSYSFDKCLAGIWGIKYLFNNGPPTTWWCFGTRCRQMYWCMQSILLPWIPQYGIKMNISSMAYTLAPLCLGTISNQMSRYLKYSSLFLTKWAFNEHTCVPKSPHLYLSMSCSSGYAYLCCEPYFLQLACMNVPIQHSKAPFISHILGRKTSVAKGVRWSTSKQDPLYAVLTINVQSNF